MLLALALAVACGACAGSKSAGAPKAPELDPPAGARGANLAGERCRGNGPCVCRNRNGDPAEASPPDAAHKRFEIRMSAYRGSATLDSPALGHFSAGGNEACFYVDVVPGTIADVTFTGREGRWNEGVGPTLDIAEYGPAGPWWYETLDVRCVGPDGRCTREAADAWGREAKTRQRGRLDPCGSAVVSRLRWDTSGGTGDRDQGLYRDFTVSFTMEVKRFATQFRPGATECVPK